MRIPAGSGMSMPADAAAVPLLIRRKITLPERDARTLLRKRVNDRFSELANHYGVIFVRAAAGSGKTTATLDWVSAQSRPVAWLTVDVTDAAPGRLLTYLEASLAKVSQQPLQIVEEAMARRIPHAETAGILAESVAGTGTILVIDDADRIAHCPEALEVLTSVARYLPDDCHLIVITQVDLLLNVNRTSALAEASAIEDDVLAFSVEEAASALAKIGRDDVDASAAVSATSGWVTAVMFDAWPTADTSAVGNANADRLHRYLSSNILDRLSTTERAFLVQTSLLDSVSADRAQALGLSGAGALLASLRVKHIPATWAADGESMRIHTVFRTYLQRLLSRKSDVELKRLRRSYGQLLAADGDYEDAVEQFLAAGDTDSVIHAIRNALPGLVRRMDFGLAERWLSLLERYGANTHPDAVIAALMIAVGREQYWRVAQMADSMSQDIRESVLYRSATCVLIVTWCYWHLGRIDDARTVFAHAHPSRETDIARATIGLTDDGPIRLPALDTVSPGPLDSVLLRIAYYCGRFTLLEQAVLNSPWATAVASAWRVGVLRATGHTEEALKLYEQTSAEDASAWLHMIAYPELLHDLGRSEDAFRALFQGRDLLDRDGSWLHRVLSLLLEAKFYLRFARDTRHARQALGSAADVHPVSSYAFLREARLTLEGYADIVDGNIDAAVAHLSAATETMWVSERLLHLPPAEVYLAEALWRRGDEDASELAGDRALRAAQQQGSNFLLLQALSDFPEVSTRAIDAERDPNGPWHSLGRALVVRSSSPTYSSACVYLHDFGPMRLIVGDAAVKPRIRKSLELLAFLLDQKGGSAPTDIVLDALFDGRDSSSSRSYLRQAVYRLREVLPEDLCASVDGKMIRLDPIGSFESDSLRFTRLLYEASSQRDEDQLRLLETAIELADHGEYAADVTSEWAVQRRRQFVIAANDARYSAALLSYRLGHYSVTERHLAALLEHDPYREQGWELTMRLASSLGDADRVVATYRRCCDTLAELGMHPSKQTQGIFDELRRR